MRMICLQLMLCQLMTACSSWPQAGSGGGEAGGIIAEPTYLSALTDTQQAGLLAQSEVLDAHVELMIVQGASRCVPAAVLQLQQQGLRVRRQISAGLLNDVADDLAVYQHQIRQVRLRFSAVRAQTQCAAAVVQSAATEQGSQRLSTAPPPFSLFTLLFDNNSAEIGAGYQRHLQWIAQLLKSCECQLFIVGHTDQHGSATDNLNLSQRRVEAVQQALAGLGVQAEVRQAAGEQALLLREPASQLLNRRVELWVQAKSATAVPVSADSLLMRQWQDAGVMQFRPY